MLNDLREEVFFLANNAYVSPKTYLAERTIELELRQIESLIAANSTHIEQWLLLIDRLTDQLKELGDVANWAQTLRNSVNDIRRIAQSVKGSQAKAP